MVVSGLGSVLEISDVAALTEVCGCGMGRDTFPPAPTSGCGLGHDTLSPSPCLVSLRAFPVLFVWFKGGFCNSWRPASLFLLLLCVVQI